MKILYPFTDAPRTKLWRISDFTAQGLRLLLIEERSLQIVVPLALEQLETNALVQGQSFPGDLLVAVLWVSPSFWLEHPECHQRLNRVLDLLMSRSSRGLNPELVKAVDNYYTWSAPLAFRSASAA